MALPRALLLAAYCDVAHERAFVKYEEALIRSGTDVLSAIVLHISWKYRVGSRCMNDAEMEEEGGKGGRTRGRRRGGSDGFEEP